MRKIFSLCSSFTSLDLSNFNTNNIKYMSNMFSSFNENCNIITLNNYLLEELGH